MFECVKIFEKYDSDVLFFVIFDEIGLVEILRFNFLKVMYFLLEFEGRDRLEVVVVGILSWFFDLVEMKIVIYLLRLDMDEEEFFIIG